MSAFAPYIVGGLALFMLYKKLYPKTVDKVAALKVDVKNIKAGLPDFLREKAIQSVNPFYSNTQGYISQEQARINDAAALQAARAAKAAGFAPVIYGA